MLRKVSSNVLCIHREGINPIETNTTMTIEITKEAAHALIGNDEYTWCDFETSELCEKSYYKCHGVMVIAVFNYVGSILQYYAQDINA